MMAVDVFRVIQEVIRPGKTPYCRICLRTGAETKLVKPKNLVVYAQEIELNLFTKAGIANMTEMACYLCEAAATTALRFMRACCVARSVQRVTTSLHNFDPNQKKPPAWIKKQITQCEVSITEYRKRTCLKPTAVLVIDSFGVEWRPEKNQPLRVSDPPSERTNTGAKYETVVLDDDDEQPAPNTEPTPVLLTAVGVPELPLPNLPPPNIPPTDLPKLVPIQKLIEQTSTDPNLNLAALLPNQMQIVTPNILERGTFILHPVELRGGVIVAPSLGGIIQNGQLVPDNIESLKTTGELTEAKDNKCDNKSNKLKINSNVFDVVHDENEGAKYEVQLAEVDSILKNALHNKLMDTNAAKKRNSNENFGENFKRHKVTLDTVNTMIANKSDPLTGIENVISNVDVDDTDRIAVISEVVSHATKVPVEKGGMIDFEDKIPMDVISFVDATDPNERGEFILPDQLPQIQIGSTLNPVPPVKTQQTTAPTPAQVSVNQSSANHRTPMRQERTNRSWSPVRNRKLPKTTIVHDKSNTETVIDLC